LREQLRGEPACLRTPEREEAVPPLAQHPLRRPVERVSCLAARETAASLRGDDHHPAVRRWFASGAGYDAVDAMYLDAGLWTWVVRPPAKMPAGEQGLPKTAFVFASIAFGANGYCFVATGGSPDPTNLFNGCVKLVFLLQIAFNKIQPGPYPFRQIGIR
jgi:hypothetical protein